jgi:transcriptional regulator with XRE-family HTH domain
MNNIRDEKWLKEFGEHFRGLRKKQKFTQKALAFEAEVEISQISRLETGKINPTLTSLLTYAKALKIPATLLLDFNLEGDFGKKSISVGKKSKGTSKSA